MNRFDKTEVAPYYEKWESIKEQIKAFFAVRDPQAVALMEEAIQNYSDLLEFGGKEKGERSGLYEYTLFPLNGDERFEFVKARIRSHYSYIQLDALYAETRKKAARLSITKKKS
ncbi:YpoC family protein [Sporosarcina sp. G11-34]|uniref:YpoC family protein n=1 Tax=Sporosarcina sp. G11-34 TaxID=2849605 RepID=UPI0022A9725D|nr:hypothetical protein [Sporosarcina sp. G11-34]MCZ2258375.1 hypothetical protein [Sporosarcina sp. G11-34]